MKRMDDEDAAENGGELFLREKTRHAIAVQIAEARQSFSAAMETYAAGDPAISMGLLEEALRNAEAAAGEVFHDTPAAPDHLEPERLEAQSLCNTIASVFPLLQPELLMQLTDTELSRAFKFKKGGSFKGKGGQKASGIFKESRMIWRFYVDKNVNCQKICLVSVFHFRGKDKKIVVPAKKGFSQNYIDSNTQPRHENTLPHGGKDVNGYALDTPFYHPFTERKVECPCYPGKYRINEKGQEDDKAKRHIGGADPANAQKTGFVEYFETAVICFDKKPYVVLNSMKWRTDGRKAEFLNGKGKPTKSGKVEDLGDASPAFKRALLNWIKLAKAEHKIKDIDCNGLYR